MNKEQMRARLAEIVAKLDEYKALKEFSADDLTSIDTLSNEFESLKSQIEALEKIENMTSQASASVRKVEPAAKVEVGVDRRTLDTKGGFNHSGEFFKAVATAANTGRIDKRLTAGMKESVGEEGGFLIPIDFRQAIVSKVNGDQSLLPRTTELTTSSNHLSFPVNEVAPWDGSGIQAYWEGEGATATETKGKFKNANFHLSKLTAYVKATEELLDDASALESYIKAQAPMAMVHKVNSAIIAGSGVGMPTGLLNSGFKYKVAKEGGQAADTFLFENSVNMLGRLLPMSKANAVWLVNPQLLAILPFMKFDLSATNPVPVFLPGSNVAGAPFGTLHGIPLFPLMGGVKALGDEGDMILADLSYYYSVVKTAGIKQDISMHAHFITGETAFRFTMRMAGSCPFQSPVTTENGAFEMSGFVTLADRA